MGMQFQYTVKVNGLAMGTAPTFTGALAVVTKRFHNVVNVTIERRGELVWKSGI